jgi:hypothetical protein
MEVPTFQELDLGRMSVSRGWQRSSGRRSEPLGLPSSDMLLLLRSVSPQPQMQKQFAIQFCTTSYRTEMEAKHCLEKIFSGTSQLRGVRSAHPAGVARGTRVRQPHGSRGSSDKRGGRVHPFQPSIRSAAAPCAACQRPAF